MSIPDADKDKFDALIARAAQPLPEAKEKPLRSGGYNAKRNSPHIPADDVPKPHDESHQSNASFETKTPQ